MIRHGGPISPELRRPCRVGGFIPAAGVNEVVEPGSMYFVFGGNGFFGYFFSEARCLLLSRLSARIFLFGGQSTRSKNVLISKHSTWLM
ncbi:uncharacterized protein N7518_004379 [Penicillium psychrosexuale]|uniref:uncharacterized protein n=1 Tax=Penicillium psychrosexuale TaxID=1002107 RepID=UPI002544E75B|nr:uncharacterized protein N7518_004379 [Penicillium psychrosexuale]KAJ5795839.1 hypothetical protein N7518_004379 [Penicillium psychrosexuale]